MQSQYTDAQDCFSDDNPCVENSKPQHWVIDMPESTKSIYTGLKINMKLVKSPAAKSSSAVNNPIGDKNGRDYDPLEEETLLSPLTEQELRNIALQSFNAQWKRKRSLTPAIEQPQVRLAPTDRQLQFEQEKKINAAPGKSR